MSDKFNKQVLFDNIAFLVKERGLKIGELETGAGVSPGYISRASKEGGPTPGIEFIANIARELQVSIDTLISAHMAEMTPTERYIISFLEKMERDTNADKLDWSRESADSLNRTETDCNGIAQHPLFSYETFYEQTDGEYPDEVSDCRFISHAFDVHTSIAGDCFHLRMKNGTLLYLMNISKSVHRVNDADAYTKEVWIFAPGNGSQYLCCTRDITPIGSLVDSLYAAVCENSRHPKIKSNFQYAINAFMQDDISDDDDGELPF